MGMVVGDATEVRSSVESACTRSHLALDDYQDRRNEYNDSPDQKFKASIVKLGDVVGVFVPLCYVLLTRVAPGRRPGD